MNKSGCILVLFLTLISASCSKILDFGINNENNSEKNLTSAPVSMEFDGVLLEVDQADRTRSQFYLRNNSFSYYIKTYFPKNKSQGGLSLKFLISSGEGFSLNKWYSLPSEETENVWESFAKIEYDGGYYPSNEEIKAVSGKVLFSEFNQTGSLNYSGEGVCAIRGEFEITLENKEQPEHPIEIKNGKFYVPKSNYWDSRAMED